MTAFRITRRYTVISPDWPNSRDIGTRVMSLDIPRPLPIELTVLVELYGTPQTDNLGAASSFRAVGDWADFLLSQTETISWQGQDLAAKVEIQTHVEVIAEGSIEE